MNLDRAIEERHSVRRFSTKKVDWRKIIDAIDSAHKAPLAGNVPAVRFIFVANKDLIRELADAAQQQFIGDAQYVVVVCTNNDLPVRSYGSRGKRYCTQEAGAAIQNFLLKLTDLGLASCWVGAFADEQVKRILKITKDSVEIEAILPIGYEMPPVSKQRFKEQLNDCMFFDKWGNKRWGGLKLPEPL